MFYQIAQSLHFLLKPTNHIVWLPFICFIFFFISRKWSKRLLFFTLGYFTLLISPLFPHLLWKLEHSYAFQDNPQKMSSAIVLSGGTLNQYRKSPFPRFRYNKQSGRFLEAFNLLRQDKIETLHLSTGDPNKIKTYYYSESDSSLNYVANIGLPLDKIKTFGPALNTYQEAKVISKMMGADHKPFYLITSALHMKRSMAVFNKLGLKAIPYPVDYKMPFQGIPLRRFSLSNIETANTYLHELIGMLAYKYMGYL